MVKINNNNSINTVKSVRFGEQAYSMPISTYDTRYKQSIQQPQIPDIYTVDDSERPSFKESFVEGPAGMVFKPWIEHPLGTLATFIGLGFGMDWFAKKCGGEYEKSLVGKVANFGDNLENSSFAQSAPMKKTGNFLSNTTNKIKKFLGKSDVLKAANEMSIQAENPMAKGILYTTEDEIVQEFSHHIVSGREGLGLEFENLNKPIKLKNLYMDKDAENFIKNTYGKTYRQIKNTAEAEKIANHITLKRLGIDENEISNIINDAEGTLKTKTKVLEIMGKDLKEPLTPELLRKIEANPKEYKDVVRKIAENTKGKIWCAAGDYEWMGPIKRFFKRKISMDSISNKFKSVAKDSGHTSAGRFLSKAVQTMYRGLTFGQGKLGALLFIAPGLVEMAINTKKADKDKKIGTGAWGFINAISWPITFILGGKIMYGAASMHNAGISKENLKKIDDIINGFNLKNEKREFGSFKEYLNVRKACKKEIKTLRKTPEMSLFGKMIKKVSGILSYDLKKFNGYRTNSGLSTFLNKIPVGLRGKSGLVLKFCIFMFAIQPLIDGAMHKCCNAIFGKDYDPSTEDEQKEAKKAQKQYTKDDLRKRLYEVQALKQNPSVPKSEQQKTSNEQQENSHSEIEEKDMRQLAIEQNMQQNSENIRKNVIQEELVQQESLQEQEIGQNVPQEDFSQDKELKEEINLEQAAEQSATQEDIAIQNEQPSQIAKLQEETPKQESITQQRNTINNNKNTDNVSDSASETAFDKYDNYSYIPNQDNKYKKSERKQQNKLDNYTYIPSSNNTIKRTENNNGNKYIPSQKAGKFSKTFDNSGLNDALKRADRAEQQALKILAGNFD